MHKWINPRGHGVAVLYSGASRDAYARQAAERGQTYTFTDARDKPRTWLKGEYAYLAPNAASLLLARHEVDIDHDTGVLRAQIALDGWDIQRAAAVGMEFGWTKDLVRMLGERGLVALRDLVPDVRIPVGIERGIDLPGVSGGVVTIPRGRLPLDAAVARVLPLSGRLWAMVEVTTTGWQRPTAKSVATGKGR